MDNAGNHAIVFGASGIIGWSVVNQLLSGYPARGVFSKVTAITNRSIDLTESQWSVEDKNQGKGVPELQLVSGIDLKSTETSELVDTLREKVRDVDQVSHVYYFVFAQVHDQIEEVAVNTGMLEKVVSSISALSANLKFVVLPGGTRGYGIYRPGGVFTPPLTEDMVDNLPADYAKTVVYPANRRYLSAACRGKAWTWCEICPDAIIGFTPNGSQYSLALHWAQYLSLYAHKCGVGPRGKSDGQGPPVQVPFTGNSAGYDALASPVSASILARFAIYASTHPESCGGGQLFNVADREEPSTFKDVWPAITAWFGLEGVGPRDEDTAPEGDDGLKPGEYVERFSHLFADLGLPKAATNGVGAGRLQLDSVGWWLTFDRQLSLKKLRASGFDEEREPANGWLEAFEMFSKAGLIIV